MSTTIWRRELSCVAVRSWRNAQSFSFLRQAESGFTEPEKVGDYGNRSSGIDWAWRKLGGTNERTVTDSNRNRFMIRVTWANSYGQSKYVLRYPNTMVDGSLFAFPELDAHSGRFYSFTSRSYSNSCGTLVHDLWTMNSIIGMQMKK
jgi:hypothetical protein